MFITDEGLNGLRVHVANERNEVWAGTLDIMLLREAGVVVAERACACTVDGGTTKAFDAEDLLGGFYDTAYAYRFGPPSFDLAVATLRDETGNTIATAVYTPTAFEPRPREANVHVTAAPLHDEWWTLRVNSEQFLYAAHVDINGFVAEDNYFHVVPGREVTVRVRRNGDVQQPRGCLEAINLASPARVEVGG
jgi:beta-mannosidase